MVRANQTKGQIPPRPPLPAAGADARERILATAYELFNQHGLGAVGVDRIVAEAGVAKTTLYRHFRSKEALAVAVLQRHELLWTRGWLEPEAERLADSPGGNLLAIFDALDEWFAQADYEGCLFINTLLETRDHSSPVRQAAIAAIEHIYEVVQRLAEEAGVLDPEALAHQIQILMRGCIVAALEGGDDAVKQGRLAAQQLHAALAVAIADRPPAATT
jgi:AcrR family transcriptional regulator